MGKISHESILKKRPSLKVPVRSVGRDKALALYRFMVRLRRLQEEIIAEYHPANEMRCPVHFAIGQEAVPAAVSLLIRQDDVLFGPHRSHGYYLSKGGDMNSLVAELYGKKTGADAGKSGSQEISKPEVHFYSGAILSGLLAMAVGVGLGFKLKKKKQIAVAGFGDGATDEGIFWEAINYAQLCRLPVVFLCENNRYSTYSPQWKRQTCDNIHKRVESFCMESHALYGNDALSIYKTLAHAFDHARSGKGPVFIEAYTYRWKGHVGPEDDDYVGYRPVEELETWKKNNPVILLEKKLEAARLLNVSEKKQMLEAINMEIAQAFRFAKASPFPEDSDWEDQNYNPASPAADRLLKDEEKTAAFDHGQAETRPEPY